MLPGLLVTQMKKHIYNYDKWCGLAGLLILCLFLAAAALADLFSPHQIKFSFQPYLPVSVEHLLGTNDMGYDIFSELLHASRISLGVGLLASVISVFAGTGIGVLSGYYRGVPGELLTGLTDIFLLVPFLPLMVILAAYAGPSVWNIVLVIGLLGWCSTARVVRARAIQLKTMPFVEALRALGISDRRILISHIIPNASDVISAKFVTTVAGAMLSEAALSFLGLGDPAQISWGTMIHYAFKRGGFVNGMWNWYLPPGLCIALCAMGFVLIGLYLEERDERVKAVRRLGDEINV